MFKALFGVFEFRILGFSSLLVLSSQGPGISTFRVASWFLVEASEGMITFPLATSAGCLGLRTLEVPR